MIFIISSLQTAVRETARARVSLLSICTPTATDSVVYRLPDPRAGDEEVDFWIIYQPDLVPTSSRPCSLFNRMGNSFSACFLKKGLYFQYVRLTEKMTDARETT